MTQSVAVVTGASRGLGAAVVLALVTRGWHVVAVARTVGGLEDLDDRCKASGAQDGALTLAPMDITDEAAMQHLCRALYDRWGRVDLWAHMAIHAAPLSPVPHLDMKDWDRSYATNTRATAVLIGYVAPLLAGSATGTALFVDDPRGGDRFFGAYGATKSAQIALARSWQSESAKIGPRVLIEPVSPMPTALRARFFPGEDRTPLSDPNAEAARLIDLL